MIYCMLKNSLREAEYSLNSIQQENLKSLQKSINQLKGQKISSKNIIQY